MRINIETNMRNVIASLENLEKNIVPKALAPALNKTASGAKTDAKRDVAKRTGIKQKDITKRITISKATKANFSAVVKPSTEPFRLAYFKHTNRKRSRKLGGVRVKVWGSQKVYAGSFVGQMKTKRKGETGFSSIGEAIFARTSGKMRSNKKKQRIRQLFGATVEQTFRRDDGFQKLIQKSIKERFDKEFTRAFNLQISKIKK